MNDERTRKCLRQVEHIHGHLWTSQLMMKGPGSAYDRWNISMVICGKEAQFVPICMIDTNQRQNSNRHPLTILPQITVLFKGILKSTSFPNSQIYGRFENLKKDIDLSYSCLWRRNRTWIWGLGIESIRDWTSIWILHVCWLSVDIYVHQT
jgi:hypothetical protein